MSNRIVESLYRISGVELSEARNPENEAFNKIIIKICNNKHTEKDIDKLRRMGYKAVSIDGDDMCIVAPNGNSLDIYGGAIYDSEGGEIAS